MRKENPAEYCAPKEGNVSYHMWKLGRMNILIRTRDDGIVIDGNQQVGSLNRSVRGKRIQPTTALQKKATCLIICGSLAE